MMNSTVFLMLTASQFHRISSVGDVTVIDKQRYLSLTDEFVDRNNMTGQVIIVQDVFDPHDEPNPDAKYVFMLWELLEESLKFKTASNPKDVTPWEIHTRQKVDLVPLFIAIESRVITTFYTSWYKLYVGAPEPIQTSKFYISMLSSSGWIASVGMMFTLLGVMFSMYILSPNSNIRQKFACFMECFLFLSRVITNKATMKTPRRSSLRIFYITATIFSFMLLIYYSALMASKLAITFTTLPINSLEDVLKLKTHRLCMMNQYPSAMLILDEYKNERNWSEVMDGEQCESNIPARLFPKLCKNKAVGLYDRYVIKYIDGDEFDGCTVVPLKQKIFPSKVLLATTPKFPFIKQLQDMMLKIQNVGLHDYLRRKAQYVPPVNQEDESYRQVSLSSVYGLLSFYLGMGVISVVIFIMEMIHHSAQKIKI